MTHQTKPRTTGRRVARIIAKTLLFLFAFILLVFVLLLTPPAQRFLTARVEHYLQKKLQTKVTIGSIRFGLTGNVSLKNVYLEDRNKDTLLSGGLVKARLNYFKLFSNEVSVKDLAFENITAKIKRELPDTIFNFQFIVDAFTSDKSKTPADTSSSAPMKLNVNTVSLKNVNLVYTDVINGSDLFAHIGNAFANIDTLDPYTQHFALPSVAVRDVTARMKQIKPLATPHPVEEKMAKAVAPIAMKLNIGVIDLGNVAIQYDNDVSAFYTTVNIGHLRTDEKLIDLQNNKIYLDQLAMNNSSINIRLGRKQQAVIVEKEVKKDIVAQKQAGWDIRIANTQFLGDHLQYDNDNNPKLARGIDFGHFLADSLNLVVNDFVMNEDSIAGNIAEGRFKEKSGFKLDSLRGQVLYANNQSYLRNLYLKTPGSEIKRNATLQYASFDELTKNFPATVMDVELVDSRVQVKDILAFAPALASNPALRNPNDVWYINIIGKGTANNINFQSLQFDGLSNTKIDASGTLTGLMNPKNAGGNFTIRRFQTSQTDIALFTGSRLSTAQINLPETFNINGRISGNSGHLVAALNINTTSGFVSVNGRFSDLTDPNNITYNAAVRTSRLRLGTILRQPQQIGNLTGNFNFNGRGLTPNSIHTAFTAAIASAGFNQYLYSNIKAKGNLNGNIFNVDADVNDPNADLNVTIAGNFSSNPAFTIDGMVDSIKTLPLHLTTEPMVFRGKINGTVSNLNADNPDANILVTNALLVSRNERQSLDSIQLISGTRGGENFMQLKSDIANASIHGQYHFADLPLIIQNSIQPYFSVAPAAAIQVQPYNFQFTADIGYAPIITALVPGLTTMDGLHASGSFATNNGMNAIVTSPHIVYNGTDISNLSLTANTGANGLVVNGSLSRLKSGSSFDIYTTRLNATINHNNIDFRLGMDDQNGRNKYHLAGLLTQPSQGTYTIRLKPDSLLLNYETWTVNQNNYITISPNNIVANNFVLRKGEQQLSLNSLPGSPPQSLQVGFQNFQLATITGFIKGDSLLVNGSMNGTVTFKDILKQPVFTSDLTINDLSMKKDTIGNVRMQVSSAANNRYITNATITGRGNDVSLTGSFAPVGNDIALDLDLDVRALQLHTMEGAFASAITNASGAVNGKVKIKGTTKVPDVKGNLNFDKASFAITALGSQFNIDGESLAVTEDGFRFDNFVIKDSANNALTLNGSVLTNNFINYEFDLGVKADKFTVLNSQRKKNSIYFGKLTISTDVHITGTEVKPAVDGAVTVEDGTNMTVIVPQQEPGVVMREGVVEFVDMDAPGSDSLFRAYDSLNTTDVVGFDVAANIEIKKEAILNVIVDEANGDFLNIQGEALLTAGIDPSGKITLVGNYTLDQGSYQISFNFIQRKFDIEKGSTITWTGEPTTAQLRVNAMYVANTAPLDLVADQISAPTNAIRNTYLQKLPFEVHLNLTGELLKPVVAFDIVLPEDKNYGVSNDIVTAVQSKLSQLREDQGEVNKQVFSLLLLGRFVGENPFASSGGGFSLSSYAKESVSKLLTEQLNQLAGGLIDGVDLNFDVVSADDYTTGERRSKTDLSIGLSKRLLNDRLKVSVGNNFQLEGPQRSNQQNNNIAGNIAVDYQVSRDGRYMLRFYRRNEYEGIVDGYIIETGMSFILSVDYDKFMDILRRKKVTPNGVEKKSNK